VTKWRPDVLVTQLGCDTHQTDPLANMYLTTAAYQQAAAMLHRLAHDAAGGRWLATGGGGYQWARVVPRAWTIYFAEMTDRAAAIPDAIPDEWLQTARRAADDESLPTTLSERVVDSRVNEGAAAWVVGEIKRKIFPHHDLD
jgi:acetoin utilization protein AcuC